MKLLIIGNADSIWVKRYIEHVLLGQGFEIYVTLRNRNPVFKEFYNSNGINVVRMARIIPLINRIPYAQSIFNLIYFLVRLLRERFDVIHIHYMDTGIIMLLKLLKRKVKMLVGTFWGSDLFRASEQRLKRYEKSFKYLDYITLSTKRMHNKFHQVYNNKYDLKIRAALFGISGFDDISLLTKSTTKNECKKFLNIPESKTIISIGYSGDSNQQHENVLNSLISANKGIWKNVYIVLPMTYGNIEYGYIDSIKVLLDKIGCEYQLITDFLSDIDIAKLRVATDIFIHAQTTDAFSASVQEYLFSGAVVLNPKWISYEELRNLEIEYIEYSDFNELPKIIEQLLGSELNVCESNRIKLESLSSWASVKENWLALYR